jgi:hypothetical protein
VAKTNASEFGMFSQGIVLGHWLIQLLLIEEKFEEFGYIFLVGIGIILLSNL